MIELPPRSSPRSVLVAALANLARFVAGSQDRETAEEIETWVDDVEALLQGREPPSRVPRPAPSTQGCSNCGRAGHNRTTCSEPDRVAKLLAPTVPKTAPEISLPITRLAEAGHRERAWAATLEKDGRLPLGLTAQVLLDWGLYDPVRDEVAINYNGAALRWKVERA